MKLYEAKTGNHQGLLCQEKTGENIAIVYDKANAAYIVKCVNAHEALLEALKLSKSMLVDHLADCPRFTNDPQDTCNCGFSTIEEAIALAESEGV